jgi:hypothetical protein
MSNLQTLQEDFFKAYHGHDSSFERHIKVNGPSPQNRFAVYKGNIQYACQKALALLYPLTWALLGEECANGAAYRFHKQSLPMTGNLDDWGAGFSDFLEHFPPTQDLVYLPDFARLEWLKHQAYRAEDQASLSAHDFKTVTPEDYGQLVLQFHPSAYLFSSAHPLDQIMAVLEGKAESVELETRGSHALIIRPSQSVHLHWLTEEDFAFFSLINQGYSLLEALEKMGTANFQFHETLSFSLQNGLFSEYTFKS